MIKIILVKTLVMAAMLAGFYFLFAGSVFGAVLATLFAWEAVGMGKLEVKK